MSAERDPRASRLEDDPFDRTQSPGSHTRARDDGNWRKPHVRVVFANKGQGGQPFFRVFGEEPQPRRVYIHKGSIWHFSKIEIEHLTQATLAFSLALAFMNVGGIFGALNDPSEFVLADSGSDTARGSAKDPLLGISVDINEKVMMSDESLQAVFSLSGLSSTDTYILSWNLREGNTTQGNSLASDLFYFQPSGSNHYEAIEVWHFSTDRW